MPMRMRLGDDHAGRMGVHVVLVVPVRAFMVDRLVQMLVVVPLGKVLEIQV